MIRNVAIMGATGAVGQELLKILEQRNFPLQNLKLLASERSVGREYEFKGEKLKVELTCKDAFKGVDLVLSSAGASVSKEFAPIAVDAGAVVVDNTSFFRMDPNVPLVKSRLQFHLYALRQHAPSIQNRYHPKRYRNGNLGVPQSNGAA